MRKILKEHKENFIKIFKLARIDLIKTYRGSVMGCLWSIIKPIITIFAYWFTIEIGLRSGKMRSGYPNFLWLIASTVPWFYFSEMIVYGATSIKNYSYLVTKMKFPISIIPTIVNLSKFIVHIVLIVIVVLLFRINGYKLDIYMLQVVFYMLMSFLFLEVWSIFSSMIGAISKDFVNLVRSINILIFWLSGIIWDVNSISINWVKQVLWFNPIAYLINGYRNCFINKVFFFEEPIQLLVFIGTLILLTILAVISHNKLRKEIADVL